MRRVNRKKGNWKELKGKRQKSINMLQTENDYKRERELNLSSEVKQREEH